MFGVFEGVQFLGWLETGSCVRNNRRGLETSKDPQVWDMSLRAGFPHS